MPLFKLQTVVSEQSEIRKANYAIPHRELSALPQKPPRWPNQFEQLILEAEFLSMSLSQDTCQEHTRDNDLIDDSYKRLISDLSSPITRPDCSLGSRIVDPFDAFPSKHCSQDYELVSHCKLSTTLTHVHYLWKESFPTARKYHH